MVFKRSFFSRIRLGLFIGILEDFLVLGSGWIFLVKVLNINLKFDIGNCFSDINKYFREMS